MDSASIKRVGIEKAQNFMRQYRDPESRELKKLSANQFMDVWSHYDKDGKRKKRKAFSTFFSIVKH
jgi:calretinin